MYDVIIIGAGPAGLAAAIYTGRNRYKTLVLSTNLGGQTAIAGEIENYPGFESISGIELSQLMQSQAQKQASVELKIGPDYEITKIDRAQTGFTVIDKAGNRYDSRTIIITAGKEHKRLNIPGEKEFEGRGVSFCATCDAPFFKDKVIAVIGGGYSATEACEMLIRYAQKVYVLNINDKLNGELVTLEKISAAKNVQVIPFAQSISITNDCTKVTGVQYKNTKTGETAELKVDGVFVEIGSIPNTKIFGNLIKLNQWGEVEIGDKNNTSVSGLFAAGDITNVWGKQTVIAAGEGAKAAMAVNEFLSKLF